MENQEIDSLKIGNKVPNKTFFFYFVVCILVLTSYIFIALIAVLIGEIFGIRPGNYLVGLLSFLLIKPIWNMVTKLFTLNSKKEFLKAFLVFIGIVITCIIMVIIGIKLN